MRLRMLRSRKAGQKHRRAAGMLCETAMMGEDINIPVDSPFCDWGHGDLSVPMRGGMGT